MHAAKLNLNVYSTAKIVISILAPQGCHMIMGVGVVSSDL